MSNDLSNNIGMMLKKAIVSEIDGYSFYELLASESSNDDVRNKLMHLGNDERRHKSMLINMYKKLVGGDIGELPEDGIGPLSEIFNIDKFCKSLKGGEISSLKPFREIVTNL